MKALSHLLVEPQGVLPLQFTNIEILVNIALHCSCRVGAGSALE